MKKIFYIASPILIWSLAALIYFHPELPDASKIIVICVQLLILVIHTLVLLIDIRKK